MTPTETLHHYKSLGDRALAQLTEDSQFHWSPSPNSNSIATIVKHLAGNMRSRWTDFTTTDGEKPDRNRDDEFAPDGASEDVTLMRWYVGWTTVFAALDAWAADGGDPEQIVYIRGEAHYAYHVGQLVYLTRLLAGDSWQSLSIPVAGSAAYNAKLSRAPAPPPTSAQ